jgi:hypothetical protein
MDVEAAMLEQTTPAASGGQREGAGRKPIFGARLVKKTITLPEPVVSYLQNLGGGNLSAAVRDLGQRAQGQGEHAVEFMKNMSWQNTLRESVQKQAESATESLREMVAQQRELVKQLSLPKISPLEEVRALRLEIAALRAEIAEMRKGQSALGEAPPPAPLPQEGLPHQDMA